MKEKVKIVVRYGFGYDKKEVTILTDKRENIKYSGDRYGSGCVIYRLQIRNASIIANIDDKEYQETFGKHNVRHEHMWIVEQTDPISFYIERTKTFDESEIIEKKEKDELVNWYEWIKNKNKNRKKI